MYVFVCVYMYVCKSIYIYIHPGSSIVAPPTISRIVDHRHLALKLTRNRNSFFALYTMHEVFGKILFGKQVLLGTKTFRQPRNMSPRHGFGREFRYPL